jgi:hypothetical protein
MSFSVAGVGVTELFALAVFIAFALFSFRSIFNNSKFGPDKLAGAVRLGLRPLALVTAFVSLAAGGIFLLILVAVGAAVGGAVGSPALGIVIAVIGVIGLLYALFASAYALNYLALAELREGRRAGFGEAIRAFFKNQGQVLLLPAVIAAILLVELGVFALVGLGRGESAFAFAALFAVVFFPVNLVLFVLLFLGCGIFLPVMIDRKVGALGAFRSIATAIKQQAARLVAVQTVVISFLGMSGLVLYLVFKGASSVISAEGRSPIEILAGELLKNPLAVFQISGGNAFAVVSLFLASLVVALVLVAGAAVVWSLNMSLYASLYLGYLKESVDFEEPVFAKKRT